MYSNVMMGEEVAILLQDFVSSVKPQFIGGYFLLRLV